MAMKSKSIRASVILSLTVAAFLLLTAACSPAESSLSISDVWARAAMLPGDEGTNAMGSMDQESTSDADEEGGEAGAMAQHGTEDSEGSAMGMGAVSAAYMVIENAGRADDRLVSVSTEVAGVVEIHTVEMQDNVMRMRPLENGLEIPAGEQVSLQPGGYHIMLMQLNQDLAAGETIALTLTFESGKEVTVDAEIRTP